MLSGVAPIRACLLALLLNLAMHIDTAPAFAGEGTSEQLWANFIIARPISEKLFLEYDIEGAYLMSGGDPWRSLYGTGLVEFYPSAFVDLTAELVTGVTRQNSDEDSFEVTGRLGFRFHFINQFINSPLLSDFRPERMSGKRFSIANLVRVEWRNFQYSGDTPSSSDTRLRNRIETKAALNKSSFAEDGVWHVSADMEWFIPLEDEEAPERFATKRRARLGLGYRHSYRWRFDVLLMWDDSRDTIDEELDTESYMLDFRFKMFL